MALLVPAKGRAQHRFCQPAIQKTQLPFVVHVLEVVVEDRNIANAPSDHLDRHLDQDLDATSRIRLPPPTAVAAESKAKQIPDLAKLVSGESDIAAEAEQQTQMAEAASGREGRIGRPPVGKQQVGAMTW